MSDINLPDGNKYLPKDTQSILPSQIAENYYKNFNFFYLFNLPNMFYHRSKLKIQLNEDIAKFYWDKNLLKNIENKITYSISKLEECAYKTVRFDSTLSWRMIIGLGASHPQETSMTLHHIYGIPYIPGSAVKGVTRHWVIAEEFKGNEETAEENDNFKNVFGSQEEAGRVIFFDAYPVDKIRLKVDVMTPHYPDYYSKGTEPADWQSPNPIKFLTVEKTKFCFYIASKKQENELCDTALKWLKNALMNFGIGAKTSVGYGYFDLSN